MPNPYIFYAKIAGAGIAVLALIALAWSWHSRGQEIERLTDWQDNIIAVTTVATVRPDSDGNRTPLKPDAVATAIQALSDSYQSADRALQGIATATEQATRRSEAADALLGRQIADLGQRYARSTTRITDLIGRQAVGTPAEQCEQIAVDTEAPWGEWK